MGYMIIFGNCFICQRPFTFNATWVPSITVEGVKQPVCKDCMTLANHRREEQGLEPHYIHPEAYEPEESI
jgi:hypothetical protein